MTLEYTGPSPSTTSLDRIWEALERGGFKPQKRANNFKALCPIHADAQPSLSVKYDAAGGKVVLYCFGCGDVGDRRSWVHDLTTSLGLTDDDLFDAPLPADRRPSSRSPRPRQPKLPPRITHDELSPAPDLTNATWVQTKVYEYIDDDGVVQQRVHREEATVDGKRHKRFTQSYRGSTGRPVKRKPADYTPLLYNLHAVRESVQSGGEVWLLEGEKDADSAIAQGLVGTTNAGGATAFPQELLEQFRGSRVNLVVDNDGAGARRAAGIGAQLVELGISARVLLPNVADRKSDFTDHLDAGGTPDTLIEISVDDAHVMVAVDEAEKLVHGRTGVAVCLREAIAQLEEKHQDRGTSERHAEAWARESLNRFDKLNSVAATVPSSDHLGPRGKASADEYRALLLEGAQLARDTYVVAGLAVPTAIASALAALTPIGSEQAPSEEFVVDAPTPRVGTGGGGGGVFFNDPDAAGGPEKRPFIQGTDYQVVDGQTVLVKYTPDGNGGFEPKYTRVMNGWAEVLALAVEDDGADSEIARAPHLYTIRFHRHPRNIRGYPLTDKETGKPIVESMVLKYSEDQVRDGSWAQALPWPGFLESNSRRGRDSAWDAILKAVTPPSTNSVVHTTIGWRTADTGPYFIHATGAIAKGGTIGVEVDVDKTSSIYAMPAPTTDRDELRQAWEDGTLALRDSELPARVVAPLLGHAWTAPVLPGPMILHLVGGFASYKSSHSRLAVQYFAQNLTHMTKGLISGASGGATTIGLQRTLSSICFVPVIVDDFAPDGDAKGAIRRISALGRTVFNGIGRIRAKQRGGTDSDRPILASIITSGELSAQGSADSRIVNLPLDPATVQNGGEIFGRLESRHNRRARALIGATLVQWIAGRRDQLIEDFTEAEEDVDHRLSTHKFWRTKIPAASTHAGLHDRLVQSAVVLDRGIAVMLMMLRDLEVISVDECRAFYAWARDGIAEAISMQDSSASDPAEQLMEYLREAIANGNVHLSAMDNAVPLEPGSVGWTEQSNGMNRQWRANGQRLGVINGDRVYLFPSTAISVANNMSQRADEAFSETKVSISSSLKSHGWLIADSDGKRSVNRRLGRGSQSRVWDVPLAALMGSNDDGTTPTPDDDGFGPAGDFLPPYLDSDAPEPAAPEGTRDEPPVDTLEQLDQLPDPTAGNDALLPSVDEAATPPAAQDDGSSPKQPAAPAPSPVPVGQFRAPLGVLDEEGLWLSNGDLIRIRGRIEHVGQLARLAADIQLGTHINAGANKLRKTERGQIYLTKAAALSMGLAIDDLVPPTDSDYATMLRDATKDAPFLSLAAAEGYSMTGDGAMRPSIDVWREDDRAAGVHVALIPAQGDAFISTILHGDPDSATIARRLGKFTMALKFPYRSSAGTTGIKLMTSLVVRDRQEQVFRPIDKPAAVKETTISEGDFNWQRALTDEEQSKRWVHGFDRGGSYLAATSVEVGIGEPTHHDGPLQFTRQNRLPGYWSITVPELGSWLMPDLFGLQGRTGEGLIGAKIWVTTPTMEIADELGIELEIHEAYLWHEKGRVFDSWYQRMRDARSQLDTDDVDDQLARDLLKRSYVAAIGMLDFRGDHDTLAVWAPHRHDMIVAKSRANIIRRVIANANRTGLWPVAIEKDTIVYVTDVADGAAAWPGEDKYFGRGLGQYKYEGSDTTTHHLEFLTGKGPYKGKPHLNELI
ncbi:CHC2 zinc finger domain-containing protein [Micromonospora sp. DT81.3]|uniref:CHC2 zinc finger domain-containing protein n=1 Tax=Micromonospora sp. DT81.3 TaxID=3416523 RepID=UPI003CED1FE6